MSDKAPCGPHAWCGRSTVNKCAVRVGFICICIILLYLSSEAQGVVVAWGINPFCRKSLIDARISDMDISICTLTFDLCISHVMFSTYFLAE